MPVQWNIHVVSDLQLVAFDGNETHYTQVLDNRSDGVRVGDGAFIIINPRGSVKIDSGRITTGV